MNKKILIAGATGNLGGLISAELLKRGAKVRAIVRESSNQEKIEKLKNAGVEVLLVDMENQQDLETACKDISCVISVVAGLRKTIVDFQSRLVDAAVTAKVPRFIPSDFSTDFTQMDEGLNRNFDLRKEFKQYIDKQPIKATSIFNGAFAYLLNYNIPLFNVKESTVIFYDGKQDFAIDFSTLQDTASYTAAVALDEETPRDLHIASFSPTPKDLVLIGEQNFQKDFEIVDKGSLQDFGHFIKQKRAASPEGEQELYADWQQMQYLHSMFLVHHSKLDNERYPELQWTTIEKVLRK